jgi:hypothetical protein
MVKEFENFDIVGPRIRRPCFRDIHSAVRIERVFVVRLNFDGSLRKYFLPITADLSTGVNANKDIPKVTEDRNRLPKYRESEWTA